MKTIILFRKHIIDVFLCTLKIIQNLTIIVYRCWCGFTSIPMLTWWIFTQLFWSVYKINTILEFTCPDRVQKCQMWVREGESSVNDINLLVFLCLGRFIFSNKSQEATDKYSRGFCLNYKQQFLKKNDFPPKSFPCHFQG